MTTPERIAATVVGVAVVQPGDSLIVSLPRDMSRDAVSRVVGHLRDSFAERSIHVTAIVGAEHMFVLRPGEATA